MMARRTASGGRRQATAPSRRTASFILLACMALLLCLMTGARSVPDCGQFGHLPTGSTTCTCLFGIDPATDCTTCLPGYTLNPFPDCEAPVTCPEDCHNQGSCSAQVTQAKTPVALIAGVSVLAAVIVLAIICIIVFIVCLRRRRALGDKEGHAIARGTDSGTELPTLDLETASEPLDICDASHTAMLSIDPVEASKPGGPNSITDGRTLSVLLQPVVLIGEIESTCCAITEGLIKKDRELSNKLVEAAYNYAKSVTPSPPDNYDPTVNFLIALIAQQISSIVMVADADAARLRDHRGTPTNRVRLHLIRAAVIREITNMVKLVIEALEQGRIKAPIIGVQDSRLPLVSVQTAGHQGPRPYMEDRSVVALFADQLPVDELLLQARTEELAAAEAAVEAAAAAATAEAAAKAHAEAGDDADPAKAEDATGEDDAPDAAPANKADAPADPEPVAAPPSEEPLAAGGPAPDEPVSELYRPQAPAKATKVILIDELEQPGAGPYLGLSVVRQAKSLHPTSVVSIYDGHGGISVCEYIARNLHLDLMAAEAFRQPTDFPPNMDPSISPIETTETFDEEDPIAASIFATFVGTNANLFDGPERRPYVETSGSTAVVSVIHNKRVWIAWAGDSEAVLCRRNDSGTAGPLHAQVITEPTHKPGDPVEAERVRRMGGEVYGRTTNMPRVAGILAVSRAFGNGRFSQYVKPEPTIKSFGLNGSELFIILACDGLWDVITGDEACNFVYANLEHRSLIVPNLIRLARRLGSTDNITISIVFFDAHINKV
ncbi:hypothetical protein, variant [Fonticula alba]|uniref:PPM-type phosphatase domain-containing protein n=1 Tax=Fonticula alba TaxID=691883 RepID=A0A058Z689_FONAL|nr:hypothetical protein, variant [Fonticula alba]KCV69636.1 hypothetical protein, variant [Fonticula alba]|eukprot:XP_009496201.1 hypothetical protein, variant [Fonticula alba]